MSVAIKFDRPVKLRQKSITETARNIKYKVLTNIPASDNAWTNFEGFNLIFLSKKNKTISNAVAHQPAEPASPAEFWNICKRPLKYLNKII